MNAMQHTTTNTVSLPYPTYQTKIYIQPVKFKNIVFDVGNVLVRWSPTEIVRLTFGNDIDGEALAKETVFIEDMPFNVEGARVVGIEAIQFKHAEHVSVN